VPSIDRPVEPAKPSAAPTMPEKEEKPPVEQNAIFRERLNGISVDFLQYL
jgi:hypothetical protein